MIELFQKNCNIHLWSEYMLVQYTRVSKSNEKRIKYIWVSNDLGKIIASSVRNELNDDNLSRNFFENRLGKYKSVKVWKSKKLLKQDYPEYLI